jgi:hypothetical protein
MGVGAIDRSTGAATTPNFEVKPGSSVRGII